MPIEGGHGIGQQMELAQLRSENQRARNLVSRAVNTLEQVKIALDEEDYDEAMRLVNEALGND